MRNSFALFICVLSLSVEVPGTWAQEFVWAKQLGGTVQDYAFGVAVETSGNVYTGGVFAGTADFDPGLGTYNLTSAGGFDVSISKLDSAGNFVWAKRLGGTGGDEAYGVAVDVSGNVYIVGYFSGSADFDPGPGTYNLSSAGSYDAFTSKLDSAGNFVWAKRLGGTGDDRAHSVTVDASGNVYTVGWFRGTADFDPGPGTYNLTSASRDDAFVSKLDPAGNFIWAKQLSGTAQDFANGVTVDANGNVYTVGYFGGTADFDPGPGVYNLTSGGGPNAFVSKLDSAGNFVWAKQLGGVAASDQAQAQAVAVVRPRVSLDTRLGDDPPLKPGGVHEQPRIEQGARSAGRP